MRHTKSTKRRPFFSAHHLRRAKYPLVPAVAVGIVLIGALAASSKPTSDKPKPAVTAPSSVRPGDTAVINWGLTNTKGRLVQRGFNPEEKSSTARIELIITPKKGAKRVQTLVSQTDDDGRELVRMPKDVKIGDKASFHVAVFPEREPVPGTAAPSEPRVITSASSRPALVGRTPFAFLATPPGGGGGGGGSGGGGGGSGGGGGGGSGGGGGGGGGSPQSTATPTPVAPILISNIKAEGSCTDDRITVSWTTSEPTYANLHHGPSADNLPYTLYTQEFSKNKTLHIGYAAFPIQPTWHYQIEAISAGYLTRVRSDIKSVQAPCAPAPNDTTPPIISGIRAEVLEDNIAVSWTTDEPTAESYLFHGPDRNSLVYQLYTQELAPAKTLYIGKARYPYSSYPMWYYKIRAVDVSRNVTESGIMSITIPAQ